MNDLLICENETENEQSNNETLKEDKIVSSSKLPPPPLPSSALKPQFLSDSDEISENKNFETHESAELSSGEEDCDSVEHIVEEEVEVENENLETECFRVKDEHEVVKENLNKLSNSSDDFEQNFNKNNSCLNLEKKTDSGSTRNESFEIETKNDQLFSTNVSNEKSIPFSEQESLKDQMTELQAALDLLDYNIKSFSSDEDEP